MPLPLPLHNAADWVAVGPPHKQRYLAFKGQPQAPLHAAAAAAAGGLLSGVKQALFESGAFARLLKSMIGIEILKHAGEVRRFRAGACCVPFGSRLLARKGLFRGTSV